MRSLRSLPLQPFSSCPRLTEHTTRGLSLTIRFRISQTVKQDALKQPTQAYLNETVQEFKDSVKAKKVFILPKDTRSYYRSMFDLVDFREAGVLTKNQVQILLASIPLVDEEEIERGGPDPVIVSLSVVLFVTYSLCSSRSINPPTIFSLKS
jgi:hypothetical protein